MIVEVIKQNKTKDIVDLKVKYCDINTVVLEKLHSGCSDEKHNGNILWTFERVLITAQEMSIDSPFDEKVLVEYLKGIDQAAAEKPSHRVYRSYFKRFIEMVCPESAHLVARRKGRSDVGKMRKNYTTSMTQRNYSTSKVNLDEVHAEAQNLAKTAEKLSTKEHTRKRQSPDLGLLKIQPESNVIEINKYIFEWVNSSNAKVIIDVRYELNYIHCDENVASQIADLFRSSSLSDATKSTYLNHLRQVFEFNATTAKQGNPLSTKVMRDFMYDLRDKVQRGLIKNSNTTLSQKQRWSNAILKLAGLKQIPKPQQLKIKAGGNELTSDAYVTKEWTTIIRELHFDRKKLIATIDAKGNIEQSIITQYMSNCCLMLAIYSSATQKELFTSIYPDQKVSYLKQGAGSYVTKGIKNRASKVNNIDLNLRHNGMKFLKEFLTISRKMNAYFKNTEYSLFLSFGDDGKQRELTTQDLHQYSNALIAKSNSLRAIKQKDSKFTINTQRIRSSIVSKVQNEKGEASSVQVGRHTLSANRTFKYSRGNRRHNQQQASETAHVMEEYGRNHGNLAVAIENTKVKLGIDVLTSEEHKELKKKNEINDLPNGGTCKNLASKEKEQFKKGLDSNPTLSEEDKKIMGCGYLVKCFGCSNFGVIDEVIDIWRLLSFEKKLNESIEFHVSLEHYIKNYGDLKLKIGDLKSRLTPQKLKAAIKRLEKEVHPFWDDEFAVSDVLRAEQ
ncbi:hypothetical protein [Vibrio atlanticus]|uniref:hypothetical protein n=1 Tax=Vibrio atlanticus TaxID=693153 RepID=UPI00354EFB9C